MFDYQKCIGTSIAKGKIVGFNQHGVIMVETENDNTIISCYCLRSSKASLPDFSLNDLVAFTVPEDGKEGYILGLIEPYIHCTDEIHPFEVTCGNLIHVDRHTRSIKLEGKTIRFEAADDVTIVCGKSSIHMTKEGTVAIRGAKLVSRSSGINKIKGAAVTIN